VVVATELATGAERRLRRGPVIDAVLASAAIPGVFPPVHWDGVWLCDGGVVANVPVTAALDAGADEVWVLDTSGPCELRRRPRTIIDVALQALALMGSARVRAELACPPGKAAIHHVALRCRADRWFTDFGASAELLDDGAAAARRYLEQTR
jgi:NTE family protein